MSEIEHVTDETFEEQVLNSDQPVLVDYWAEWCGPCKMIEPIVTELAEEYKDQLTVVKVNIDKNSTIPSRYGVRGIPALMLFKHGEVEATTVGLATKAQLINFLNNNI